MQVVLIAVRTCSAGACLLLLAGCIGFGDSAVSRETAARITSGDPKLTALARRNRHGSEAVRIADRPWYGSARERSGETGLPGTDSGHPLPGNLEGGGGVALSIPVRTGLGEAAGLVSRTAGLPVTVDLSLPPAAAGGGAPRPASVPELGQPLRHDGPLSALLDRLSAEYDVFWTFNGSGITISAFDTRSWPLPVPQGATSLSSAFQGLAGGQDSVSFSRSSTIDDWNEITALLTASIHAPPAVITALPGIGRVSVTGRPSDIAAADRVIVQATELASHRIGLEVGIYYLDSDRSTDFAMDLLRLGEFDGEGADETPTALLAAGGAVSILGDEAGPGISYTLNFQSLARNNAVLTHRTASTVAVSGAVTPIRLVSTRNYVSSVSVNEEGQRTVETDKVDDGIAIQIIPRIIDRETLRLSITVGQADLLGFDVFGDVQLPRVDHRTLANDVVMAPGETLVLSGYEQGTADLRDNSGLLSKALDASIDRVTLVLMVRPTLLPHGNGR